MSESEIKSTEHVDTEGTTLSQPEDTYPEIPQQPQNTQVAPEVETTEQDQPVDASDSGPAVTDTTNDSAVAATYTVDDSAVDATDTTNDSAVDATDTTNDSAVAATDTTDGVTEIIASIIEFSAVDVAAENIVDKTIDTAIEVASELEQSKEKIGALELGPVEGVAGQGEVPAKVESRDGSDNKFTDSDAMFIAEFQDDINLISPGVTELKAKMSSTLLVEVMREDGTKENLKVEVEREGVRKKFFGGWRHKATGKEYLNVYVQTVPKRYVPSSTPKNCRETQTVRTKNIRCQTKSDTSTQMTKTGCWVSDQQDKVIIAGDYVTADEKFEFILRKVIILQSYFRRWKAKRYVDSIRQDHLRRIDWEKKEEERKRREKEKRLKEEYQRRMHPLSKEDFDLVYHALELWRREEVEHINATKSGPERKAALAGLMDEETELIASIERHKLVARKENNVKFRHKFLERCAAPKKWIGFDGMPTKMDTPNTIRAKDLKDTYESLEKRYLSREERLDILLQLKLTVKEHDCKLTKDIVELIDREADLLMRGTKEKNLDGLRKRISTLFLQYIKTPLFNPEVANFIRVPEDPSTLRKNIYYCRGCNNYLPSTDFELTTNARSMGRCRKCKNLDSEGRLREDFSKYRSLLYQIREIEEAYNDNSRVVFLMTEADLRYLTENIWAAQSVLSQWEDTYDLTLVRWNRKHEWSPWNCILLTNEEARAHAKLIKPEEAYGATFTQKIRYRHILAKQYFSTLPKLSEYMSKNLAGVLMPLPSNAEKVIYGGRKKAGKETLELPPLQEPQTVT